MWTFRKFHLPLFPALLLLFLSVPASATTYYVDINSTSPMPPYTSWSNAATNIQSAVDLANPGDLVLVNNGIYSGGGRAVSGTTTNCVVVTNSITVQSLNGPSVTFIQAYPQPWTTNGTLRCVYLGTGSTICGFTLMNGSVGSDFGGGIDCQSAGATVSNCVMTCDSASYGGGAAYGTYANCVINSNTAVYDGGGLDLGSTSMVTSSLILGNSCGNGGGGIYCELQSVVLNGCTIVNNNASSGGGIFGGTLTNCISYYNVAGGGFTGTSNVASTAVYNSCTTPTNGLGADNIVSPPGFVNIDGGNFRLAPWSPCIDAGNNIAATSTIDLDGNPRIVNGTVDIGAYEYQYQFTNFVHFVALNSTNPVSPYTNWIMAATNIQAAIDASQPGDFIVVSNGLYNTGSKLAVDLTANRIAVDMPVTVQSLSGNNYTLISGNYPSYPGIRCAYLTNGATLIGLTLTNGYSYDNQNSTNETGGGVWCQSTEATVENCVISHNDASYEGGGAYSGTLLNCMLVQNTAIYGGGIYSGNLGNCALSHNVASNGGGALAGSLTNCLLSQNSGTLGGAACSNTLYNCTITQNGSNNRGGGAYSCILSNCMLIGNRATNSGGGAYASTLTNCLISQNWATNGGGVALGLIVDCAITNNSAVNGGGLFSNTVYNCLIANNTVTNSGGGVFGGTLFNSVIANNMAGAFGGGAIYGSLNNCTVTNNYAIDGGGVCSNTVNACNVGYNSAKVYGGGVYGGTLNNCLIYSNIISAQSSGAAGGGCARANLNSCFIFNNSLFNGLANPAFTGAGAFEGTLISCVISNNYSNTYGGGAAYAVLTNCLIISNSVPAAGSGSGTLNSYLYNCTVVFNHGGPALGENSLGGPPGGGATNCIVYYNDLNYSAVSMAYCCTYPLPASGFGNFTNAPLFVNLTNDFQLQPNSPCINSGNNAYATITTDLNGAPRIVGGTVDMGAYEYQTPTSVISYAYLQQYGLPTDGSADFVDLDGTGFNIYQDWIAGLNPTNSASVLIMLTPAPTNNTAGITVTWQSITNIFYDLQRSTNLPVFNTIHASIIGHAGTTSYTDATATNTTPYFYRVGVP